MQKIISTKGATPKVGPGFRPPVVQAKLTVNQPGDRYEREADAVADRVVSMRAAPPLSASAGLIAPSLQRKCSACEESDKRNKPLLRKAQAGGGMTASPGLVSQLAASQAGGTPLAARTRSFMESAFSSDFSRVRVHQDAAAADMSRQIGARAFTHGNHIYFNQGQYQPHTRQGAHLLAHELTHTLQQAGPDVQYGIQRVCGPGAVGEHTECTPMQEEATGPRYLFQYNCDEFARGNDVDLMADAARIVNGDVVEIHGYASEEGDTAYNNHLSCARALRAREVVESVLRTRGISATIRLFHHGATPGNHTLLRSVVVNVITAPPTPQPQATTPPVSCPPPPHTTVRTIGEYIDLIRCAEASTSLTPRQLLAVLRQMYYGAAWSATSQTTMWNSVITCHVDPGNPRNLLPTNLVDAFHGSVEVMMGSTRIDIGHVFTGLEAMLCPAPQVSLSALLPMGTVALENESFATWGGDLGATAAAMVACWDMNPTERSGSIDCGRSTIPMGLPFYFNVHAPNEDLEGDIDPYVMRAHSLGIPCGGSQMRPLTLSGNLSDMFLQYYTNLGDPATTHTNRYRCFAELIGATVAGNSITNKSALAARYVPGIEAFSMAFYSKIMQDVRGRGMATFLNPGRIIASGSSVLRLGVHAQNAFSIFMDWLESRL